MPNKEKVINELEEVIAEAVYPDRPRKFMMSLELAEDALALLKAQEPIEARLNLCESCSKEYPECDATVDGVKFGSGIGNDNIIGCTAYVNRWKAQEPSDDWISRERLKNEIQYYIDEAGWGEEINKALGWCLEFIDNQEAVKWE